MAAKRYHHEGLGAQLRALTEITGSLVRVGEFVVRIEPVPDTPLKNLRIYGHLLTEVVAPDPLMDVPIYEELESSLLVPHLPADEHMVRFLGRNVVYLDEARLVLRNQWRL